MKINLEDLEFGKAKMDKMCSKLKLLLYWWQFMLTYPYLFQEVSSIL